MKFNLEHGLIYGVALIELARIKRYFAIRLMTKIMDLVKIFDIYTYSKLLCRGFTDEITCQYLVFILQTSTL
jgi:hypothetical protein